MRKMNAKFNTAFLSEPGSFLKNRDYFAFVELDDFACYAIADGIGDDVELESGKIAVTSIIRQFSEQPSIKKANIKTWLEVANKELLALSKTMRLKASVTVVVTDYTHIVYGLAGNTRILIFSEGALIQQSTDQSLSSNLLEEGKIPLDKIAMHVERNNLYCYLGKPDGFSPEISERIKLVDGDVITLFTRGIWENVDAGEITDAIKDTTDPQEVLNNVEDLLLSKQPTKLENYTLATIFVDKTYQDPSRRYAMLKKIAYIMLPILIISLVVFGFYYHSQERKKDELAAMSGHIASAKILLEEDNYARAADEYKAALNIAQQLKLPTEQKDFENYYKTAGLIVAADTALQHKEYGKAIEKYRTALDTSYFADLLGQGYIRKQMSLTSDYITVHELLQLGDQKAEHHNLIGARQSYLEAKVIASKVYFTDGRKEAAEKLAKLGEQMVVADKKSKSQEASVYEQQGDRMAQKGDYTGAVAMLSIATGMYDQGEKGDKAVAVQKKIATIEDKMTTEEKSVMQSKVAMEGENYEKEGDKLLNQDDFAGALEEYGLAISLYEESSRKDKVTLLQKKIDNLNNRKQNADKFYLQRKAMDLEKDGDLAVAENQFDDARNSYNAAQQIYGTAGLSSNVGFIQKKIDLLDQKLTSVEQQRNKANAYVADGDDKMQKGEYTKAEYLYLLANDIYRRLGMQQEEGQVNGKIKVVHRLAKNER